MKAIVYLLGLWHIALGTYLVLHTKETVNWLNGLFHTYQLKYLSVIPAAIALQFLVAAPATTHSWVFRIFGLLAAVEAAVAFANPKKIYSEMLEWYFTNVSGKTNRLFGMVCIVFGTVILTWIK
jgi:uncharacterized protein YjeT (DUF2065 family)